MPSIALRAARALCVASMLSRERPRILIYVSEVCCQSTADHDGRASTRCNTLLIQSRRPDARLASRSVDPFAPMSSYYTMRSYVAIVDKCISYHTVGACAHSGLSTLQTKHRGIDGSVRCPAAPLSMPRTVPGPPQTSHTLLSLHSPPIGSVYLQSRARGILSRPSQTGECCSGHRVHLENRLRHLAPPQKINQAPQ